MAYMSQEKKQAIAKELKKVIPAGWKYTLKVENHTLIRLTFRAGPVDLMAKLTKQVSGYAQLNEFYLERAFNDPEIVKVMVAAAKALNTGNFDNSDIMSDYTHVGHYVAMQIGDFDKPYNVI